jgi:hypothetical protein
VCGTGFKVTLEELSVADGALQCGHCQAFFNAEDMPEFSEGQDDQGPIQGDEPEAAESGTLVSEPEPPEAPLAVPSPSDAMVDPSPATTASPHHVDIEDLEDDQVDLSQKPVFEASAMTEDSGELTTPDAREPSAERMKLSDQLRLVILKNLPLPQSSNFLGSLLLALFLTQLLWIAVERLYRTPALYGPAAVLCDVMGCELDRFQDIGLLRLDEVSMTAWAKGRARVRARLTNAASFAQDLPMVLLTLSDQSGRVLAARTLDGQKDYQVTGAQGSAVEASGEVRIVFDIAEDSSYGAAVSYQMELVNTL